LQRQNRQNSATEPSAAPFTAGKKGVNWQVCLLFLQCSHNFTMFVGWLPYIILKSPTSKSKKNEVPTAKNAPHLNFTLSTMFPQLHHVYGVVTIHN